MTLSATQNNSPIGTIYSVGHSDHSMPVFVELLKQHRIQVLVDTRSYPSSQHCPHFSDINLPEVLKLNQIKYLFLGKELGGRPRGKHFYDEEGRVLYWKVACSNEFKGGLDRVIRGAKTFRVALMCSEENPQHCHRRLLVGRMLYNAGFRVLHIRKSGEIQEEESLLAREILRQDPQRNMFETANEIYQWKSTRSVLRKEAPSHFLRLSERKR